MMKTLLAAVAAFVLVNAAPAFAACPDCKDCPNKVAAADKAEKKDAPAPTAEACKCATAEKGPCKCAEGKCHCAHEKKAEPKKS